MAPVELAVLAVLAVAVLVTGTPVLRAWLERPTQVLAAALVIR
jgi:hypothetical protein